MNPPRNVAILIFNEVEVLDFCGPLEVFSVTGRWDNSNPFNVYTVAEKSEPVMTRNNLCVNPSYTILDCPQPHIFLVPGGYGTRREMNNTKQYNLDRLDQGPFARSRPGSVRVYRGSSIGESWFA